MRFKQLFKRFFHRFNFPLIVTIVALLVILCAGYIAKISFSQKSPQFNQSSSATIPHESELNSEAKFIPTSSQQASLPVISLISYGHFAYQQANPNDLMIISSYAIGELQRLEYLAPEVGKALMKMIYSAREEGIWILPVSGFRTIEQQQKLFKEQIKRRNSPEAAAKVSAPPGYSEHHTGYAVDLTDGHFPKQDITLEFEKTNAYRWLTRNAQKFGFELSFYQNNPQGVSYEPWHWRYVASKQASAIFAQARKNH